MSTKPLGTRHTDRREAPRVQVSLDVKLQLTNQPESPWNTGRIRDISVRGFYFFSPIRHEVGSLLRFSVPWQILRQTKEPKPMLAGIGSIVRCEELGDGEAPEAFGIAVKIVEPIASQQNYR
jgi:hypothetical protein